MEVKKMVKKMTAKEINKKYKGIYVEVYQLPMWDNKNGETLYEVRKKSKVIRENTTLGEDVGTAFEYTR